LPYSDFKCFRFRFDSGVAFISIDHPPINLLDEVLSQEFDKLGRQLETDESVRVVVLQSALPEFFIAHSGWVEWEPLPKRCLEHVAFVLRSRSASGSGTCQR
jgi:enoyl-CoA hydratase/carnithine racemase